MFRLLFEREPGDRSRNRGDDEEENAALAVRFDATLNDDILRRNDEGDPLRAEIPQHGYEGAEMQSNVESESRVGPMQDPGCQREMSGAADGQEFRESLENAKDECLKDGHGDWVGGERGGI